MIVQQTHTKVEDCNRVKVIVSSVGRQGPKSTETNQPVMSALSFNSAFNLTPPDGISGFRELGNVLYESEKNRYLMPYTAVDMEGRSHIGIAISEDGFFWVDQGIIIDFENQDPFIIKKGSVYHIYTEYWGPNNDDVLGVGLHTSTDLVSWEDKGYVLRHNPDIPWAADDVSSPLVYKEGDLWYLFFEGRGPNQTGVIGLTTSVDGVNFNEVSGEPLFSGRDWAKMSPGVPGAPWGNSIVPDTLIKIGDLYYMSFHAFNSRTFASGIAVSENLTDWSNYLDTWVQVNGHPTGNLGQGISFLKKNGVLYGATIISGAIKIGVFTSSASSGQYFIENPARIIPSNRILAVVTNRDLIIESLEDFRDVVYEGERVSLKNTSSSNINISGSSSEVVLDGASSISVPSGAYVELIHIGDNNWISSL